MIIKVRRWATDYNTIYTIQATGEKKYLENSFWKLIWNVKQPSRKNELSMWKSNSQKKYKWLVSILKGKNTSLMIRKTKQK